MLGETDPSHIIRTIEYWDLEKRKYPQRQHYAVLIAETISRRFYNVIQLLSLNIPLIAIQVELLKIKDKYALNFVKVLDIYEEREEGDAVIVDEAYWKKHSSWTLERANEILTLLKKGRRQFNFEIRTELYCNIRWKKKLDMVFKKSGSKINYVVSRKR